MMLGHFCTIYMLTLYSWIVIHGLRAHSVGVSSRQTVINIWTKILNMSKIDPTGWEQLVGLHDTTESRQGFRMGHVTQKLWLNRMKFAQCKAQLY